MPKWARWLLVGALMHFGVLLVILAIGGLRELMVIGKVPEEMLSRRVGYTVGAAFVGAVLIIWCLVAGVAWARSGRKSQR